MKSIVEEASSIIKAVEKAWVRAGKPISFQTKILEEPQKNFFGLTVRSAKIGLFFDEKVEKIGKVSAKSEVRQEKSPRYKEKKYYKKERDDSQRSNEIVVRQDKKVRKNRWTPEMIKSSRDWMGQMLKNMGTGNVNFSVDAKGYYLNVVFQRPVLEDKSREQLLFKSLSHLMMQMLRTKFKKGFIGYKVVLRQRS